MDQKRELPGATAQRWQANQDLGDLGEHDRMALRPVKKPAAATFKDNPR
jgi:hypothetical protein